MKDRIKQCIYCKYDYESCVFTCEKAIDKYIFNCLGCTKYVDKNSAFAAGQGLERTITEFAFPWCQYCNVFDTGFTIKYINDSKIYVHKCNNERFCAATNKARNRCLEEKDMESE